MSNINSNYILEANKKGAARLELLNKFLNPSSKRFLTPYLSNGQSVLEVGSGAGNMTKWISNQIGDNGSITAIDSSLEQIEIAEKNSHHNHNINYITGNINQYNFNQTFDLIYSRFLQIHLTDPDKYILKVRSLLNTNGVVIFEEPTVSDTLTHPVSDLWTPTLKMYKDLSIQNNVDCDFGEKIYNQVKNHFNIIECFQYHNVCSISDVCNYIATALKEVKESFVGNNIATSNEIDILINKYESDEYLLKLDWSTFHNVTQIACNKN